jgi:hypothetical protein
MRLREVAQVGGAVTAVHAPIHRTGDAKAETRKGFAIEGVERKAFVKPGRKNLLLVFVALAAVGGALVAWLATRRSPQDVPTAATPTADAPPSAKTTPVETPPTVVPPPAIPSAEPAVPSAVEPSAEVKRPAHSVAREGGAKSPASASDSAKNKPSRAARQGLIQENPF